jgi:hypothetical protein
MNQGLQGFLIWSYGGREKILDDQASMLHE